MNHLGDKWSNHKFDAKYSSNELQVTLFNNVECLSPTPGTSKEGSVFTAAGCSVALLRETIRVLAAGCDSAVNLFQTSRPSNGQVGWE